ncbi:nucleoside recognition domain-containing protein [Paenibacillus sp. D2_2]|uniref:nucleoside recognition domain-containing protein n=1 Tax=Paenibacillus sp. D2_2 TaxID=3073092 RepID=UPI002814E263|nr:nucleoside recognition domain-containing protein [Paenibacillus sp. D2_2]WMT39225.1 nucleoside recognition domain-containing protein [Paenibacillus sp. D2_2]
MQREQGIAGKMSSTILFATIAILLVICIVAAPGPAFQASSQGLSLWWRIVFPAILPFLVLSEILIAGGFPQGLGVMLEPFTRRFLKLPGTFGWILPLGMTAGFPASAVAAASLYKQRKITAVEAETMAATAHFASPMLVMVVIGAGYLNNPNLGLLLLIIHWLSGFAAAFTLNRSRRPKAPGNSETGQRSALSKTAHPNTPTGLRLALRKMEQARQEDGRSFGKLLGDSVTNGVQTLMTIGGYMLIFAIIIHVVNSFLKVSALSSLIAGAAEIHLGTYEITKLDLSQPMLAALLGAALGWGGICSFLQVQAVLKPIGIGGRRFMIQRVLHGAYAYMLTLMLWRPLTLLWPGALPAYKEMNHPLAGRMEAALPNWQLAAGSLHISMWLLILLVVLFIAISFTWRRTTRQ